MHVKRYACAFILVKRKDGMKGCRHQSSGAYTVHQSAATQNPDLTSQTATNSAVTAVESNGDCPLEIMARVRRAKRASRARMEAGGQGQSFHVHSTGLLVRNNFQHTTTGARSNMWIRGNKAVAHAAPSSQHRANFRQRCTTRTGADANLSVSFLLVFLFLDFWQAAS